MLRRLRLVEKNIYSATGYSYQVSIMRNRKKYYETFSTLEEAIKARDDYLRKIANELKADS
jgi:hypothetical protein